MTSILGFILASLQQVPSLIAAGVSVAAHIQQTRSAVAAMQAENRGPSDAEWDELHGRLDELMKELDA